MREFERVVPRRFHIQCGGGVMRWGSNDESELGRRIATGRTRTTKGHKDASHETVLCCWCCIATCATICPNPNVQDALRTDIRHAHVSKARYVHTRGRGEHNHGLGLMYIQVAQLSETC